MKRSIALLLATSALVTPAYAACIRVGPGESIQSAIDRARSGDVILIGPGTHRTGEVRLKSGVTLRGEGRATLDCRGSSTCVDLNGVSGARIENIGVTGAGGGDWAIGIDMHDASGNVLDRVESYGHQGPGVYIGGSASDNTISNGSYHDNYDPQANGGNADGIGVAFGEGSGNRIINNRLYNNSDDGLDLFDQEAIVHIEGNEAYGNGRAGGDGNGFKLGPNSGVNHVLINNIARDNRANGFDRNSGRGAMVLRGNAAFGNGGVDSDIGAIGGPGEAARRVPGKRETCTVATAAEMKAFCAYGASMLSPACTSFRDFGTLPEGCAEEPDDGCGGAVVIASIDDMPPVAPPQRSPARSERSGPQETPATDYTRQQPRESRQARTKKQTDVAQEEQPRRGHHRPKQQKQRDNSVTKTSSPESSPTSGATIFADEFDGPSGSKPGAPWRFFDAWGSGKWRDAIYSDKYARLDGEGNLVIRGEPCGGGKLCTSYLHTLDWLNPDAPGEGKFGPGTKIEARIDFGGIQNARTWGAFWLFDPTQPYDGNPATGTEIDIAEVPRMAQGESGWVADRYTVNNHWAKGQGGGTGAWINKSTDGFHTYGLEWHPDKLVYTFDGEPVHETTKGVSASDNQALMLSLEHAVDANPWGATQPDGGQSSEMIVDWVRASRLE